MASTNTNTGSNQSRLSTDIYEISDFIDQIRKDNVPNVSDTASMVGIFGYMNEIFSQTIQNTLIAVSEKSNVTTLFSIELFVKIFLSIVISDT